MDVIYDFYYIHGRTRRNQIFFAVFDVSLNNGSTVNDTSKTAKII